MIASHIWALLQALEEHAAELKQLTGQLGHALGEGRRLQLQNEELQQASDHYQAENARLKVPVMNGLCEAVCVTCSCAIHLQAIIRPQSSPMTLT